jgi:hypothetical protein
VLQDQDFHQHYLFESGWGLLYLVLVAVPLVVLAVRPGEPAAMAQLCVVALAVVVGGLWRPAWPQVWNGLGLTLTVVVLAWLGRWHPERPHRPDPWLAMLAVVAVPAAVAYGAPLIGNLTDVEDITNGVSHYPMQASLAYAVVGLVALAAVSRSRLPAWTAAFTAAWLGVESIVYPDLPASLGAVGGALTVAWAALVVVALQLARSRGVAAEQWRPAAAS